MYCHKTSLDSTLSVFLLISERFSVVWRSWRHHLRHQQHFYGWMITLASLTGRTSASFLVLPFFVTQLAAALNVYLSACLALYQTLVLVMLADTSHDVLNQRYVFRGSSADRAELGAVLHLYPFQWTMHRKECEIWLIALHDTGRQNGYGRLKFHDDVNIGDAMYTSKQSVHCTYASKTQHTQHMQGTSKSHVYLVQTVHIRRSWVTRTHMCWVLATHTPACVTLCIRWRRLTQSACLLRALQSYNCYFVF